jgi:hypothetical protein
VILSLSRSASCCHGGTTDSRSIMQSTVEHRDLQLFIAINCY